MKNLLRECQVITRTLEEKGGARQDEKDEPRDSLDLLHFSLQVESSTLGFNDLVLRSSTTSRRKKEKDTSRRNRRDREKRREIESKTEDWCSDGSTPNFLLTSHYALLLLLPPLGPIGAIMPVSFLFYFTFIF